MDNEAVEQIKIEAQSYIIQCIQSQKYEEAKEIMNEYKRLYSIDPDLIVLEAMLHYEQNKIIEAEDILKNGAQKYPLHDYIRYNLGFMKEQLGEYHGSVFNYFISQLYTNNDQIIKDISTRLSKNLVKLDRSLKEIIDSFKEEIPKVDVIITSYNQKDYLRETINSILDQTYPNIRIIVADDCSNDGTEQMMDDYQDNCRVDYKRNPTNLGPGYNGCHAFYEYADGEYTLFVNHDDYLIDSSYIAKAVALLEKNKNLSMVWANCTVLDESTGKTYLIENNLKHVIDGLEYFMFYETEGYPHIHSLFTSLFRRENAVRMKCLTERTKSLDLFLHLKLMLTGDIGFIPTNAGVYRIHKGSISYNMPSEFDYSTIEELEKMKELVKKQLNVDKESLDTWLDIRLKTYLTWRFSTLKKQGQYKIINEMMKLLKKGYPRVYNLLQEHYEEVY